MSHKLRYIKLLGICTINGLLKLKITILLKKEVELTRLLQKVA